jgi:hypothetical protein
MLSGIGGYPFGDSLGITSIVTGIYRILDKTSFHLFGDLHVLFWPVIIVIILTAKEKKQVVALTIMTIILLMPVVPVVNLLDVHFSWARYIFHFSVIILIFGILWAKGMVDQRGWKSLAVFPLLLLVVVLFIKRDSDLQATLFDESANARKTAEEFLNSGKEYIRSAQDTWFYDGLRDINEYFYGKKIGTKIISEREIRYISEERRSDILSHGYDLGDDPGKDFRRNVIDGTIHVDGYRIAWELGPYKTGSYVVLRGRHRGLYNYITYVNKSGHYLLGKYYPDGRPLVYYLRVVYQSPEGWEGISDEHRIEIPGKSTIHLNTN